MAGLIQLAQTAKNFDHQRGRVFQLLFQFLGRVAKFLEGFGTGPAAIKEELTRPQVHFLEAIGQGVNADPVLVGHIGPFLKGFGLHPGPLGRVADFGNPRHSLTNSRDTTDNTDARHRACDACELRKHHGLERARDTPARVFIASRHAVGGLLRPPLHIARGAALGLAGLLQRTFKAVNPRLDRHH